MRDILGRITKWCEAGDTFALATVTRTYRSAPRDPGAALAVSAVGEHEVIGSVSGGCVEGAVYELASNVRDHGGPRLVRYGVDNDDAFAASTRCRARNSTGLTKWSSKPLALVRCRSSA